MQVQQMNQMRQMHQMQGQGSGQGKGSGMGQIMKSLDSDQRKEVSDLLQSMPQEDRKSAVDQIKSLDTTSETSDELYQSIMDILNPETQSNVSSITSEGVDFYA
jgi:hypothetical protein